MLAYKTVPRVPSETAVQHWCAPPPSSESKQPFQPSKHEMDVIKAEKEIAMRRFRRVRRIGQLLRYIEAAAALILFSYSSTHISAAARNSGEFLRQAASILISPRFVFFLGNAIVLVLLKSGNFSSESASTGTGLSSVYSDMSFSPPPIFGTVAEERKTVCEANPACRRSRSEKFERRREEGKLRRAETLCSGGGKAWTMVAHDKGGATAQDRVGAEEEVDAEEFRRIIEEFIAKQQRFQREESLAVVACSDGPEYSVSL